MKKLFSIMVMVLGTLSVSAQEEKNQNADIVHLLQRVDSILQMNNSWLQYIETGQSLKQRYKLYETENIYTFILLDTKTGKIEQVQWSLDKDKEFSVSINDDDLSKYSSRYYEPGSFELYPTKNMYQFILLDKEDGRKWHVQWGTERNKRWIRRID
ncbi:MAG: hypothetical protein IJ537_11080 [Bacteroidaceae bacterium]|nr:hypothetical protein [Bacteroidaceae bacterium]